MLIRFCLRLGAPVAAAALLLTGCGKEPPSKQFTSAELEQLAAKRKLAIAADQSLTDEAAIQKYAASLPLTPAMYVQGASKLFEVQPAAGGAGYVIEIRKYDQVFMGRTNKDGDMLLYERQTIKEAASFCESALRALAPRKLQSVRVRLYSTLSGKDEEVFVATASAASLANLAAAASSPAAPGSPFDPRAASVSGLWKVEKNVYPNIVYRKKS